MASIAGQNTTTDTAEERSICLFNYGNTRHQCINSMSTFTLGMRVGVVILWLLWLL